MTRKEEDTRPPLPNSWTLEYDSVLSRIYNTVSCSPSCSARPAHKSSHAESMTARKTAGFLPAVPVHMEYISVQSICVRMTRRRRDETNDKREERQALALSRREKFIASQGVAADALSAERFDKDRDVCADDFIGAQRLICPRPFVMAFGFIAHVYG